MQGDEEAGRGADTRFRLEHDLAAVPADALDHIWQPQACVHARRNARF